MPCNRDFVMSILVGGVELPEYEKDGEVYVESNLFTPVSYTQQSEELVQDEIEKQSWPVTPYQIKVTAKPGTPYSYYKIYVDGQKATQIAVKPGNNCVSEGFYDGANITEFLFSLPRFPEGKKDRLEKGKASKVGRIEVECWNSKVTGYKKPLINKLDYSQANKKDSTNVTNGEYMMATTKVGRSVRTTQKSVVEDWTLFNVRSKLSVKYVMGHSLIDMGFKLRPIRIPIHRIPASIVNTTSNMSKRKKSFPNSGRKSRPPVKVMLTPPDDEVIAIDSDDSDDLIVGDVVPAKKQKCDNSEDDVMEVVATDEQVAGTSRDTGDTEKESGDKDAEDNGDSKGDEAGEKDKSDEEKSSKKDNEEKGEKDKASKTGDKNTRKDDDQEKTGSGEDNGSGSRENGDAEKEQTNEDNDTVETEHLEKEGKGDSVQDESVILNSEIKEEVSDSVGVEGENQGGLGGGKGDKDKGSEEGKAVDETEKEKGDGGECSEVIKEETEQEQTETVAEGQQQEWENEGNTDKTESDAGKEDEDVTGTDENGEVGCRGDGDNDGDGEDKSDGSPVVGDNVDKGDGDNVDKGDGDGEEKGDGDAGKGDGDDGDKTRQESEIKAIVDAVLDDDIDCFSGDIVTVDPGGTFGDELNLD